MDQDGLALLPEQALQAKSNATVADLRARLAAAEAALEVSRFELASVSPEIFHTHEAHFESPWAELMTCRLAKGNK